MTDRAPPAERVHATSSGARFACWSAYACGWAAFLGAEFYGSRPGEPVDGLKARLLTADADALTYLLLLVLAPLAWILGRGVFFRGGWGLRRLAEGWQARVNRVAEGTRGSIARGAGWSLVVAGASLGTSIGVGRHFEGLPPAYHDEYSYLFQAKTFLAGRLSYPSHEAARLFDQMHVVNEGRFASRYFPGTGVWLAPFVAAGHAGWGHWLAGALCAVLIFWCGREMAGDFAGVVAGLLTALSPGMALFSNLLLAHHPTLVGLSVFLLGYLRGVARSSAGWGAVAGTGLCFAALCRPMTAAGVAFPYGAYLVYWCLAAGAGRSGSAERIRRLKVVIALGLPLVAGGIMMFAYDRAITGNGWKTPYDLYTETYTPRHVYGFNNVVRGELRLGPRVIESYDTWAKNLTPSRAARNTAKRLVYSWKWTLGLVPLAMALVAGVVWWPTLGAGTRLTLASIVSLYAAHVPYWFVGIQSHHYVFESGPMWMLWVAALTVEACRSWRTERRWWMPAWWLALLSAAVVLNYSVGSGRCSAPLEQGLSEVRWGRDKHGRFQSLVERGAHPRPALVLIAGDPKDQHIDYVTNDPSLDGDVLIGHYLPEVISIEEVRRLFPDRTLFLYSAVENRLERL